MLDSVFGRSFNSGKCKTLLKLAVSRIKLMKNKRDIQVKQMRRDLAELLRTGQEPSAWIRVEHIIREESILAAYEIIEFFSELIAVRLPIIESQRTCPLDLREAISSLIFAAPRCADLPELLQLRNLFSAKYGKEFVAAAAELRPDCGVNRRIIEKLSVRAPSGEVKMKMMKDIAAEHNVEWDPTETEAELFRLPEDLLEGSSQILSASQTPISVTPKQQSTSGSDPLDGQNQFQGVTQNPLTYSDKQLHMPQAKELQDGDTTRIEVNETRKNQNGDENIPVPLNKEELFRTRSQSYTSSKEGGFQDVITAARVAMESAERAAMAARAAASLASLSFSRKDSSKSDAVHSVMEKEEEFSTPEENPDEGVTGVGMSFNGRDSEGLAFDEYHEYTDLKGDDSDRNVASFPQRSTSYPTCHSRINTEKIPSSHHLKQSRDELTSHFPAERFPDPSRTGTFDDSPTDLYKEQQTCYGSFKAEHISPPPQRPPPDIPTSGHEHGPFLRQNGSSQTPAHPRLPDYDDLASRFEALKTKR